jgi:hypothetical protein
MYLEQPRAFGAGKYVEVGFVKCPVDSKDAGEMRNVMIGNDADIYLQCGGKKLAPSIALFSYDLTGTATSWKYESCKTGYTKKLSGKPHPNYYTCFKK